MATQEQSLRYEVKMSCSEIYLSEIEVWLRLHPDLFFSPFPSRRVNSMYFDTLNARCLNDNLEGSGRRTKLRLRWYGNSFSEIYGYLELKHKSTQLGWKDRIEIKHPIDLTTMDWEEVRTSLSDQTDDKFRLWLDALARPMLINGYQRNYYESADRKVRITIDFNQVAYEQFLSNRPNLTRESPGPSLAVIEVKSDQSQAHRIAKLIPSFPIQVGRNSKYVNGVLSSLPF